MRTIWLRARAPYASFRPFQAGAFRATLPTMAPSAARALVLSLAGIDIRDGLAKAPRVRLAIGELAEPDRCIQFLHLHNVPVGTFNQANKARCFGQKYSIAPAKVEYLKGLDVLLGVQASAELLGQVERGLDGTLDVVYGIPYAGESDCPFSHLDILPGPVAAKWFIPLDYGAGGSLGSSRLTVRIDREDSSRSRSVLFAPTPKLPAPPDAAWTWVPHLGA